MGNRELIKNMGKSGNIEAFYYQVYGLTLRSNQLLPGLKPFDESKDVCDISIHQTRIWEESPMPVPLSTWQPNSKHPRLQTAILKEETYLLLSFIGDKQAYAEFVINPNGEQVWMAVGEGANQRYVTSLLLGIVLGCILRIRGITCLHGNTVIVDNQAITILGAKGAGKSTTTAALLQQGTRLLADDVAVLLEQENSFFVQPGYPGLRLYEEVATQLYGSYEHLEVLTPKPEIWQAKRSLCLLEDTKPFPQNAIPLAAIYILEERSSDIKSMSIESVSPTTGLFSLMQNTFVDWMLNQTGKNNEFRVLSRLATQIPIRVVKRPDNLAMLLEICEGILDDLNKTIQISLN